MRMRLGSSIACALSLCASSAAAQDPSQFQVERFEPMPEQGMNLLNLATSKTLGNGQAHLGAFAHFVSGTLTFSDGDDVELVDSQLKVELSAGVGLLGWLDLGIVAPLVAYQNGDDQGALGRPGKSLETTALGDVRVVPKVQLLDPSDTGGLGFAVVPLFSIPTGSDLNGDGASRFEPRAILDYHHGNGLVVTFNAAYEFRDKRQPQNLVIDDVFRYGAGARVPVGVEGLSIMASYFGDIQTENDRDPNNVFLQGDATSTSPMEIDGGLQYIRDDSWVFQLGGGAGLNEDVGAPRFRAFLSAAYTPTTADRDRDGVMDVDDLCTSAPEDIDGFEDLDGCPDEDNDLDGIGDDRDICADEPEDFDGFQDDDGCPEIDNDGDAILDPVDACPLEAGVEDKQGCPIYDKDSDGIFDDVDQCPEAAEDVDRFEDTDGCPDLDNDADTITDTQDKCPDVAEDLDGFDDADGCLDPDNDRDGVLDADDKCPNEAEVINGVDDTDGCPDKGKSKVRITTTKIEILDKVFFDTGKATIKDRSFNLLSQVGQILKANPQITKLQIEGHTDDRGDDALNQKLSQDRAEAVKTYLEAQGLAPERLIAVGFGETKPVVDNKTAAGRDQNRRVEFTIIEVDGKPVSGQGPVIIEKQERVEEPQELK